jgi:hypothetical protein
MRRKEPGVATRGCLHRRVRKPRRRLHELRDGGAKVDGLGPDQYLHWGRQRSEPPAEAGHQRLLLDGRAQREGDGTSPAQNSHAVGAQVDGPVAIDPGKGDSPGLSSAFVAQ